MAEIAHATAYDAAFATTSTSYQTVVQIGAGSFVGSGKYVIFVTARVGGAYVGDDVYCRVVRGSTELPGSEQVFRSEQASETEQPYFYVYVFDQPATAEAVTLQCRSELAETAWCDASRITAIRLDDDLTENDDWIWAEDDDESSPVALSTTFADFASKTWTPGEVSDWLFFGVATIGHSGSPTVSAELQCLLDGTNKFGVDGTIEHTHDDSRHVNAFPPWHEASLSAASHTFKMQCREDASGSYEHEWSGVFGIRLDAFADSGQAYTSGGVSVSGSWTELQSLSYTPGTTANHLIFAGAFFDGGTLDIMYDTRLQVDAVTEPAEWDDEASIRTNDADDQIPLCYQAYLSIDTGGVTIDLDAQASSTDFGRQRAIIAWSLELAAAGVTESLAAVANASGAVTADMRIPRYLSAEVDGRYY